MYKRVECIHCGGDLEYLTGIGWLCDSCGVSYDPKNVDQEIEEGDDQ